VFLELCNKYKEKRHHAPKQQHNLIPSQIWTETECEKRVTNTAEEHMSLFSSGECEIFRNIIAYAVVEEKFVQELLLNVTARWDILEAFAGLFMSKILHVQ